MKFLKSIRSWLYSYIFYYETQDSLDRQERELKVLVNQYSFVLFVNFFIITIFNLINFNFGIDVKIVCLVTLYFCLAPFLLKNYRTNKFVISFVAICLTLLINYYSHYCGIGSGIFLYYLPLLVSLNILFSQKNDERFLYPLVVFIIVNMYFNIIYQDISFLPKNYMTESELKSVQLLNLTCILISVFLIYLIIIDKRESSYILENRNILKREEILNLKTEVDRLKSTLHITDISEESLKDLLDYVQISDTVFLEKFEKMYPGFFDRLIALSSANLNVSELKYCALFKLGYTTKQVAIYTDTTIKAVDSKKYRLRKKLNISSSVHTTSWFEKV